MRENVIPVDGMVITEDTRFAPGVYPLQQGVTLAVDGIIVEGEGALLVNTSRQGVGVHAENRRGVTVRGLALSGFYHGLRFDGCRDVLVEDVRVRNTYEIEGIDTFLYLWNPIEEVYSGAILLNGVQGGVVRGCDLQHQMNGILLYATNGVTLADNNASFNSGWGVYLSGSNENIVQDNRLDFCNRIYRRPESGAIRVEADAAGIVLVESSCRNHLLRNSCLCGGDGIFIAGYNHKGGKTTCDDNLIEGNDCRLSPNNAIESTFSRGNIFRRNDCSRSNYGFWMGYSWDNVMEDNIIDSCRMVGIAIEHGHGFVIRRNQIQNNREGVRLFTRGGATLEHWREWAVSYDYTLEDNLIEQNRIGFNGYTGPEIPLDQVSYDLRLRGNTFKGNITGARFHRVRQAALTGNTFQGNQRAALLIEEPGVALADNQFADNAEAILHTSELGHTTERSGWV
ncbi:MAG: right-handed parallel beta-helix repeat-containing protein [Anaerolineae bacterium]|nr:right-handed parallel beta-helix repeat-containing protein [Anaerolineae bacterium]NUQ03062.1 right-handed parallel beta-helix repeat-containing protein [Anaerolineae bacterium]